MSKREVVLENARVVVEKFVAEPGRSIGPHTHSNDRLLVFLKGGVITSPQGRSTWWRDGRVVWQSARGTTDRAGMCGINSGAAAIEMICVSLKPAAQSSVSAGPATKPICPYVDYPNVPGEDLLENERVIVQRFTVHPGEWEGVHPHHPDTLYIHIKGGQWAVRSKNEPEYTYSEASPDGEVGWMTPIDLGEGHESGNVGEEPIDLIWVTFKQ